VEGVEIPFHPEVAAANTLSCMDEKGCKVVRVMNTNHSDIVSHNCAVGWSIAPISIQSGIPLFPSEAAEAVTTTMEEGEVDVLIRHIDTIRDPLVALWSS
jgi:hypothetical protein